MLSPVLGEHTGDMVTHKCIAIASVFLNLKGPAWMCAASVYTIATGSYGVVSGARQADFAYHEGCS